MKLQLLKERLVESFFYILTSTRNRKANTANIWTWTKMNEFFLPTLDICKVNAQMASKYMVGFLVKFSSAVQRNKLLVSPNDPPWLSLPKMLSIWIKSEQRLKWRDGICVKHGLLIAIGRCWHSSLVIDCTERVASYLPFMTRQSL